MIDFVTRLPKSNGCTNIMVVCDRLGKGTIIVLIRDLEVIIVIEAYLRYVVANHWLPDAITSDRGGQFLSDFWSQLCQKLGIERRLSSARHPETDGTTERMNATVEAYLRAFVNWDQKDWAHHCPIAQIAINGRDATSTGVAPFFLSHGYNVDPTQLGGEEEAIDRHRWDLHPKGAAKSWLQKFKDVFSYVQAKMAESQQEQERQANKRRRDAPQLREGDKV